MANSESAGKDTTLVISETAEEYSPIADVKSLLTYGEDYSENVGNEGKGDGSEIVCRRNLVCAREKTIPLSKTFSEDVKVTLDGRKLKSSQCAKTMVCHDLKGGYGDDRFVNGCGNAENYVFRHWLQTDFFVYFAHKFVTIPPLGWINSAHKHGVKCLGTIITEWKDGEQLCKQLLHDSRTIDMCVDKLCQINNDFGFDGFLVNIENEIEDVEKLVEFVRKLTQKLKELSKTNHVFWYDSVIKNGKLKWQNELNEENKIFFDVCDGIYLNYNWTDETLLKSAKLAGERKLDVYVGIDVFGRGCFGGGGLNTHLAIEKIAEQKLSYAIFAPGWTFECHTYEAFPTVDESLWSKCAKYFTYRCFDTEAVFPVELQSLVVKTVKTSSSTTPKTKTSFRTIFQTDFNRGYGKKNFCIGMESKESQWFNLSHQSYQPFVFIHCDNADSNENTAESTNVKCWKPPSVIYNTEMGIFGGGSLSFTIPKNVRQFNDDLMVQPNPIWIPLNHRVTASRCSLALVTFWNSNSVEDELKVHLEITPPNSITSRKIQLGSLDHLAASVSGHRSVRVKLRDFLQIYCSDSIAPIASIPKDLQDVEFFFQKNSYDEKEKYGWRVSCYLFDMDQSPEESSLLHSVRVGGSGRICLGFISLAQLIHNETKHS